MAAIAKNEAELADRLSRFLKAELKRADVTYETALADRLTKHGLKGETRDSIAAKLKRGTFAATFFNWGFSRARNGRCKAGGYLTLLVRRISLFLKSWNCQAIKTQFP